MKLSKTFYGHAKIITTSKKGSNVQLDGTQIVEVILKKIQFFRFLFSFEFFFYNSKCVFHLFEMSNFQILFNFSIFFYN